MIIAIIAATFAAIMLLSFLSIKFILIFIASIIGGVYALTFIALSAILGDNNLAATIPGTALIGTLILWFIARQTKAIGNVGENDKFDKSLSGNATVKKPCPCGSGKRFENCHGLIR